MPTRTPSNPSTTTRKPPAPRIYRLSNNRSALAPRPRNSRYNPAAYNTIVLNIEQGVRGLVGDSSSRVLAPPTATEAVLVHQRVHYRGTVDPRHGCTSRGWPISSILRRTREQKQSRARFGCALYYSAYSSSGEQRSESPAERRAPHCSRSRDVTPWERANDRFTVSSS